MPDSSSVSPSPGPPALDTGPELEFPSLEELAALLPQYEIHDIVGIGGMGAVYRARQVSLDRWVAIKVLPASSAKRQEDVQRFIKEARSMARLVHPHIVAVFDFGQTCAGHLFLVMEFVDGTDLHKLTRRGDITAERARRIVTELCEALQFAHDHGVAHRDIKPANILITQDLHVKVADFGLAREAGAQTVADEIEYGTPDYTAPERLIIGASVDHRADIYSLGVVMHEMLTGQTPAAAGAQIQHGLPEGFAAIIAKCLQPEPEARFQKAAEVRAALYATPASTLPISMPTAGARDRPATTADFAPQPAVSHPQVQQEPAELDSSYRPSLLAQFWRRLSPMGWGMACVLLVLGLAVLLLKNRLRVQDQATTLNLKPVAAELSQVEPALSPPSIPVKPQPVAIAAPLRKTMADKPALPVVATERTPPATRPLLSERLLVPRVEPFDPIPLDGPIGEVARFSGHKGAVYAVKLTRGGRRVLSISQDKTMRLWDTANQKQAGSLNPDMGEIMRLQVTPDETQAMLYSNTSDKIALVDLTKGKLLHQLAFPNNRLLAAVYLPAHEIVLAGGSPEKDTEDVFQTLFVWKVGQDHGFQPLEAFKNRLYAMTLMPDAMSVLLTSSELIPGEKRQFRPAITQLDVSTMHFKELAVKQLGYLTRFMGPPGAGMSLVSSSSPKLLKLPELDVLATLPPLMRGQPTPQAGVAVDGGRLLLTSWTDATLRLYESATAEEVWRQETPQVITDMALGENERWAVFSGRSKDVRQPQAGDNDLVLWRLPRWSGFMGKEAMQARLREQMQSLDAHDPELAALLKQLRESNPPNSPQVMEQQRQTLDAQYMSALKRDLPFAAPREQLAYRAEMDRVLKREALPEVDETLMPPLRKLRSIYVQQQAKLQQHHREVTLASQKAAEEALRPLQASREKVGDLLGAMRAKTAFEQWQSQLADQVR